MSRKPLEIKQGETRPVEVDGQVKQVQVFVKKVEMEFLIDVEQLRAEKAKLEARIAEIDIELAEIQQALE